MAKNINKIVLRNLKSIRLDMNRLIENLDGNKPHTISFISKKIYEFEIRLTTQRIKITNAKYKRENNGTNNFKKERRSY